MKGVKRKAHKLLQAMIDLIVIWYSFNSVTWIVTKIAVLKQQT